MSDPEGLSDATNDNRLAHSDESDLAAAIREAIGAEPDEPIGVSTPQFERTDGVSVDWRPSSKMDIYGLRECSQEELEDLGLRRWSDNLWLFPAEWYEHIPAGTLIEDINGKVEEFRPGETDDDRRAGVLAYGIRRGPEGE